MDEIVAAVCMQRELVIREKAPALGVRRHGSNLVRWAPPDFTRLSLALDSSELVVQGERVRD